MKSGWAKSLFNKTPAKIGWVTDHPTPAALNAMNQYFPLFSSSKKGNYCVSETSRDYKFFLQQFEFLPNMLNVLLSSFGSLLNVLMQPDHVLL